MVLVNSGVERDPARIHGNTNAQRALSAVCRQGAGLGGRQEALTGPKQMHEKAWPGQTPLGHRESPAEHVRCESLEPGRAA